MTELRDSLADVVHGHTVGDDVCAFGCVGPDEEDYELVDLILAHPMIRLALAVERQKRDKAAKRAAS